MRKTIEEIIDSLPEKLEYKGYYTVPHFDPLDRCYFGRIREIRYNILMVGDSLEELEAEFRKELDNYLDECSQRGVDPREPVTE